MGFWNKDKRDGNQPIIDIGDVKLVIGPINIHVCEGPVAHDELVFIAGPEFDLPLLESRNRLEGFFVAYQLKDNKGPLLKLRGKSMHGNPVDFTNEEIETSSSDETILTVEEDNGSIKVIPVGPVGTAQVQVSVPGVQVNGVALSGHFDVEIVAGDVATLEFTPDSTFDLPPVV